MKGFIGLMRDPLKILLTYQQIDPKRIGINKWEVKMSGVHLGVDPITNSYRVVTLTKVL